MSTFNKIGILREKDDTLWVQRARDLWYSENHLKDISKVLGLYPEEINGENPYGKITYEQLQANTSMKDIERKAYITEVLKDFRENPEFWELSNEQVEWILRIHHKYANTREFTEQWETKTFFDLTKEDRKNIKEELSRLWINKNRQDLLVYHGICSRSKAFLFLLLIWAWLGLYVYRSGLTLASPTPTPVIVPDQVIEPGDVPFKIDSDSLVRDIANSQWVQWITTDTFTNDIRFLTIIDAKKWKWGFLTNLWRDLGITTAEFDNTIRYFAQLWYTMNDLLSMKIEWDLDDSQEVSIVTISWLTCISFPVVKATNRSVESQTDWVDATEDRLIKQINFQAWDSIISYVTKRLLPASAYHKDDVLGNVAANQAKWLANLYFWWTTRLWKFPEKTVVLRFEFYQKMPTRNDARKNWPHFNNNFDASNFSRYFSTPAWSEKKIIITVVKRPGDLEFKIEWTPIIMQWHTPQRLAW